MGRRAGRRSRTLAIVATAASFALALSPLVARSSPVVEIVYTAPAGCPTRTDVEAEIASYLATSKTTASVRATIRIEAIASGVRVDVATTIGTTKGHRVLEAATCEEGARAASLIVALAVDPLVALPSASTSASVSTSASASVFTSTSPSASASPSPSASASTSPSTSTSASAPVSASASVAGSGSVSLTAALGPALDTSALPGVAFGLAAQVGIEIDRLRLASSLLTLPATRAGLGQRDAGGSFSLVTVGLNSCVRVLGPLAPCAGFELGRMGASGFGVRNPASQHVLWKAASVGATAPLWLGRVGIRPEAWIVFPIAMPGFVLDELGQVHAPRVGVRAVLFLEVKIL